MLLSNGDRELLSGYRRSRRILIPHWQSSFFCYENLFSITAELEDKLICFSLASLILSDKNVKAWK
jgi:hypothetical protein